MNMHVSPRLSEKQLRLLQAADMIEKLRPNQFDMKCWGMCIAGHVSRHMVRRDQEDSTMSSAAASWLLLTTDEEAKLFMPTMEEVYPEALQASPPPGDIPLMPSKVSRAWAARTIRHLAYTGRVDWRATRQAVPATMFTHCIGE